MERADRKNGGPGVAAWPEAGESPGAALQRTLADRYRPPLMAFFHRRTGVGVEAEDLAQEVLARVLRRGDLDRVEKPDAFIFITARNLLRDRAEVRVCSLVAAESADSTHREQSLSTNWRDIATRWGQG